MTMWWDVITYLQTFYSSHPEQRLLTGEDLLKAADLYLKMVPTGELSVGTPYSSSPPGSYVHANAIASLRGWPGSPAGVVVTPFADNQFDVIVVHQQYRRWRNIMIREHA